MHEAIKSILERYQCSSEQDYTNALKEIFQEIALLGLWRAKFFEKAAFYGGTALRIFYGLDRFSEDLDFSLINPKSDFDLTKYNQAIKTELNGFGFDVSVSTKTKKQLILIKSPQDITHSIHHMKTIKIKMEIDTNPPGEFHTESKVLLTPIPFSVRMYVIEDLFAGKIHALLCRPWQQRVKGRDWYDFVWYIGKGIPVNLTHLKERLIQSNTLTRSNKFTQAELMQTLSEKINQTDFKNAQKDILPFINDKKAVELWSRDFFHLILKSLKTTE